MKTLRVLLAAAFVALPLSISAQSNGEVQVHWLGHAAFEIVYPGGTRILIDPFITSNPATPDSLKSLARYAGATRPTMILVSHSHSDHSADAKAIAQGSGAPVVSTHEWVSTLGLPQGQALGGNVGGTFKAGDVIVHLVPAMHSSDPGGRPLGFVLERAGSPTIYHTGDTWVFGDMALIEAMYHPAIILLNTGGGPYTETPSAAAYAIKQYFKPKFIVPMHYGTFPGLATEAEVRKAFGSDRRLTVMKPGEARSFR